jgi:hypothetical protein
MKLGELLLEARLITSEQLAEALRLQAANRRRHLGDILVDMGVVTLRQIHMALADKLGIPFVNVREFRVDPLALELLSAGAAARYRALPLVQMGDSLVVAVENPLAMDFVQELRVLTGRIIVAVIANPADLRLRIAKEYASLELAAAAVDADTDSMQALSGAGLGSRDVTQIHVEDLASALARETSAPVETKDNESDARVTDNALVRLVNKIIIDAHTQGASDIHMRATSARPIPASASARTATWKTIWNSSRSTATRWSRASRSWPTSTFPNTGIRRTARSPSAKSVLCRSICA